MRVIAGIDEAGYAPVLGPLVVGCSVFRCDDGTEDLWEAMSPAVARSGRGSDGRLVVDDSKKLYGSPKSKRLARLERSVLAFASHGSGRHFAAEDDAIDGITSGCDPRSDVRLAWYSGELAGSHPVDACADDVRSGAEMLVGYGGCGGASLERLSARAVSAAELNAGISDECNKADFLWGVVAGFLRGIWDHWAAERPLVIVDRLGGRGYYSEKLASTFGDAMIWVSSEDAAESRYFIESRGGAMTVAFRVKADSSHMPSALAGMTAKYVRELFMGRLNRFFAARVPGLRASSGYPGDAGRFLAETAVVRSSLGIPDELLVRHR